jgi:hypothetical protein
VKVFGEASQQDQVAQLAARDEGQLDAGGDEGGLGEGRAEDHKIHLEEGGTKEETEQLQFENEHLRAENDRLNLYVQKSIDSMAAAGGGASAVHQRVSAIVHDLYLYLDLVDYFLRIEWLHFAHGCSRLLHFSCLSCVPSLRVLLIVVMFVNRQARGGEGKRRRSL